MGPSCAGQDVSGGIDAWPLRPQAPTHRHRQGSRDVVPDSNAKALAAHLAAANGKRDGRGLHRGRRRARSPVLVAYRSSGATNWTTVVAAPLSLVDAPRRGVLLQDLGGWQPSSLLVGGLAALSQPAKWSSRSGRCLIRSRERIKRSTNYRASCSPSRRRSGNASPANYMIRRRSISWPRTSDCPSSKPRSRATRRPYRPWRTSRTCSTEALRELRIFTYLLHPPNLAKDGLQATLRDFAEGFAGRTGLIARIRIPEEVDGLAQDLPAGILRVVQEALSNVHRHASASRVSVNARIQPRRLVIRIRDNGHGIVGPARPDGSIRLGVGVAGMRARLEQFGGSLRIRTGRGGTSVVAMVPIIGAGPALPSAGRPWMLRLLDRAKADDEAPS